LLLPLPAFAALDDPPPALTASTATLAKVRALFAKSHDREPVRAGQIIEEWRLVQEKLAGSYQSFSLGKDERDVTLLGPLLSESGTHAGIRWQQTRNGATYTYAGIHEARDAVSDRAFLNDLDPHDVRLIGESTALNAYVVEIDPPGGRHEWRFIDRTTGNLVRREYVEKGRRYAVTFDEYRTFDGVPEPSHVRTIDSYGNERDLELLSRTLDLTPDPRDVDIPPSRRALVEFPPGAKTVHLPMRVVNGLCVIKVHIGTKDYDVLLDSGAAGIVIDPSVVDEQHLDTYGSRVSATLGTFTETTAIVPLMSVGALQLHGAVVRVVAVPFHLDDRTRIAGLLGFDFFLDAVVHLDLDHGVLSAIAPAAFKPPADATAVALQLDDKTPVVHARAETVTGRVALDTGANRSVFTPPFASRAEFGDPTSGLTQFRGLGGTGTAEQVHLKSFDLAGLPLTDVMVDISTANLGDEDIDGTAGTDLLHAYDLFFDYRAQTVYVRRSKRP
jgi:hypothetical protein